MEDRRRIFSNHREADREDISLPHSESFVPWQHSSDLTLLYIIGGLEPYQQAAPSFKLYSFILCCTQGPAQSHFEGQWLHFKIGTPRHHCVDKVYKNRMLDVSVMSHLLASCCFETKFTKNYLPLLPPSALSPFDCKNTQYEYYIMYKTTNFRVNIK